MDDFSTDLNNTEGLDGSVSLAEGNWSPRNQWSGGWGGTVKNQSQCGSCWDKEYSKKNTYCASCYKNIKGKDDVVRGGIGLRYTFGADGVPQQNQPDYGQLAQAAFNLGTQVVQNVKQSKEEKEASGELTKQDFRKACGRKPFLSKKKKKKWNECHDKLVAENEAKKSAKNMPTNFAPLSTDKPSDKTPESGSDNKILGMPKPLFWGLLVVAVVGGGFFVYKKFIAKKG